MCTCTLYVLRTLRGSRTGQDIWSVLELVNYYLDWFQNFSTDQLVLDRITQLWLQSGSRTSQWQANPIADHNKNITKHATYSCTYMYTEGWLQALVGDAYLILYNWLPVQFLVTPPPPTHTHTIINGDDAKMKIYMDNSLW